MTLQEQLEFLLPSTAAKKLVKKAVEQRLAAMPRSKAAVAIALASLISKEKKRTKAAADVPNAEVSSSLFDEIIKKHIEESQKQVLIDLTNRRNNEMAFLRENMPTQGTSLWGGLAATGTAYGAGRSMSTYQRIKDILKNRPGSSKLTAISKGIKNPGRPYGAVAAAGTLGALALKDWLFPHKPKMPSVVPEKWPLPGEVTPKK